MGRRTRDVFEGRTAIITGAASGIGRALAEQLGRLGARLLLVDRDARALSEAVGAVLACGAEVAGQVVDVTDAAAVTAAVERMVETHGRLDFIFNNAGIGVGGEMMDLTAEQWRTVIDVNLFGVINGARAAWPVMVGQGSGHIVNVGSVAGLFPLPGEGAYAASKFGVVGLSRVMRMEGADLGVRVTLVCPGRIRTAIYKTSDLIGFDKEAVLRWWPAGITADACATEIIDGVARNRGTIVVTRHARALYAIARLSDRLTDVAGRGYIRWMRRYRVEEMPS